MDRVETAQINRRVSRTLIVPQLHFNENWNIRVDLIDATVAQKMFWKILRVGFRN